MDLRRLLTSGSLTHKAVLPAVVLLLAVVGGGTFAAVLLGSIATTGHAQQTAMSYVVELENASVNAKAIANDERGFLLTGQQSFVDEVKSRRSKVSASLDKAAGFANDDTERAGVATVRAAMAAWDKALDAEFVQYATDRTGALSVAMNANRDLRKGYETQLGALIDGKVTESARDNDLSGITDRSRSLVIAFSAAAAILAACDHRADSALHQEHVRAGRGASGPAEPG